MQTCCATLLTLFITIYCCLRAVHCYSISRTQFGGDGDELMDSQPNVYVERSVVDDDSTICYPEEPCMFVMSKKNPKDNSVQHNKIPSWCRCRDTDVCEFSFYDKKKRAKTYRCSRKAEVEDAEASKSRFLKRLY